MKRVLSAVASLALVASLGFAASGTAHAGTAHNGPLTISVKATQTMTQGCRDYPVTYTVAAEADRDWTITISADNRTLDGTGDTAFEYGTGPVTNATTTVFLCGILDGPGNYEYRATLDESVLYDSEFNQIAPAATYQTSTRGLITAKSTTSLSTSHKKFSRKNASSSHPHTYTVTGRAKVFGLCMTDGGRKSIEIQYKKSGTSKYKKLKAVSIRDSPSKCNYKTTIKLKKKGSVRVKFTGPAGTIASTSRAKTLK